MEKKGGDMILILITWIVGVVCICVMKKIRPEACIAYTIYVLVILALVTALLTLRGCQ